MVKLLDSKYKNESFSISFIMDMKGLENISKALEKSGYEPAYYVMERATVGTNKKSYTIDCIRNASTGEFRAAA